ncbi:MAG: Ferredoxin [bacterium]|nr:Ferredoxin [bacterium]
MPHIICEPCVGVQHGKCAEVCPTDSIHPAGDQFMINPETCIDCASCAFECPTQAIYQDEDVPARWEEYIQKNADFYK